MTRNSLQGDSGPGLDHTRRSEDNSSLASHLTNDSARSKTAVDPESPGRNRLLPGHPQYNPMSDPDNFEDEPKNPVPGWPQVAELMSNVPDFACFNRFSNFQIKSLLYYQAELEILKAELREEELEDYRRGAGDAQKYAKRADWLVQSKYQENHRQWDVVVRMRAVLKEYNEALLQFSQVSALQQPDNYNVESLRTWLRNKDAGDFCIGGRNEHHTWGDLYSTDPPPPSLSHQFWQMIWRFFWHSSTSTKKNLDLASCVPPRKIDGFSRWVVIDFVPFWQNLKDYRREKQAKKTKSSDDAEKASIKSGSSKTKVKLKTQAELEEETLTSYSENNILRVTSSISTIVACLLPTIAITVLSQLHETRDLLLCLAGFATVFAVGLIFLGTATRVEIFGATAAFSAVMVVFISVPIVVVPPTGVPFTPGT
ncbi:hypothetical protein GLAREA_10919 [Glarea lozoyensis ATCC 20868]|uniref:DUF6594 domain-containing protein n=1 Tax=Glarea lozoyensis (strain ATCC 20868 / MF5171) TaxID=1116229 RepID=S3D9S9_GLAL2|nr:uncharacterized protein GLAREA_10919 [Glarea lozoyensis ATCC 20868]EPE35222.1 hypothetical protein GLAREA_10919 [Glarea lozoyensis ATCC 20868]